MAHKIDYIKQIEKRLKELEILVNGLKIEMLKKERYTKNKPI